MNEMLRRGRRMEDILGRIGEKRIVKRRTEQKMNERKRRVWKRRGRREEEEKGKEVGTEEEYNI